MTAAEWLACTDADAMLEFLQLAGNPRKSRLFGVACCRHIWHLMDDARSRNAVVTAEWSIDGLADEEEMFSAYSAAGDAIGDLIGQADLSAYAPSAAAGWLAECCAGPHSYKWTSVARFILDAKADKVAWLRDIFGNPFRPVTIDPAWTTWNNCTVVKLAEAIYQDRDLPSGCLDAGRMAILADALEDAGCSDEDILPHCRGPGPHVRGCWVVDLLLGKK